MSARKSGGNQSSRQGLPSSSGFATFHTRRVSTCLTREESLLKGGEKIFPRDQHPKKKYRFTSSEARSEAEAAAAANNTGSKTGSKASSKAGSQSSRQGRKSSSGGTAPQTKKQPSSSGRKSSSGHSQKGPITRCLPPPEEPKKKKGGCFSCFCG